MKAILENQRGSARLPPSSIRPTYQHRRRVFHRYLARQSVAKTCANAICEAQAQGSTIPPLHASHPSIAQIMDRPDQLYASPLAKVAGFRFDQAVVDVFPDMIKRSVPGYEAIVAMSGELAGRYAQAGSRCYDLGCSLGATLLAMRQTIKQSDCELVGVDNSAAMIQQCEKILAAQDPQNATCRVSLVEADLREIAIENASVVVLNFTLQFIPVAEREALIAAIYAGLRPGGALIISEKVCFADPQHHALMIELHHNFKRANGYSDLEIAQKRSALENVLVPETLETHRERFRKTGFQSSDVWFQCFNFASLLAIK